MTLGPLGGLVLATLGAPLAASVVVLLLGRHLPRKGDWLALCGMAVALAAGLTLFAKVFVAGGAHGAHGAEALGVAFRWAVADGRGWTLGFHPDLYGAAMLLVVPTVSFLVHVFSVGYMHGHPRYGRFFAYISFFTFAMLALVLSDNLLFFFIAWELMGLCSYLLIGFYFEEEAPQKAAIKAFLTTRIGDVLFFLGIAVVFAYTGRLDFAGIADAVRAGAFAGAPEMLGLASLFFLAGAIGKSAQFPLHVWLPDAMEGPSPVSALIHAATMVAAGIFLVARTAVFYPGPALAAVAAVGSFTAFFAATMALANRDFKKILAFSTISQLGYMLAAIGVGSTVAGLYHLTTHAFFKALLFLGSGCVLHAVHSRSLDDMGGLARKMPWTCGTMYIGAFALAGAPFFSGFSSKDEILAAAYLYGTGGNPFRWVPFLLLAAGAALTAFYTFRMMILAFHGEPRDRHKYEHAHEQPGTMIVPLILLALASTAILPHLYGELFHARLAPHAAHGHEAETAHRAATAVSLVLGLGGIAFAYLVYFFRKVPPERFVASPAGAAIHRVLYHQYYMDDFYYALVRHVVGFARACGRTDRRVVDALVDMWGPISVAASRVADIVDRYVVDLAVNLAADATRFAGDRVRRVWTGRAPDMAIGFSAGVVALVWVVVRYALW